MADTKSKALIIVGPTSSGKTSLALQLCSQVGAEVISADSRQVVRGLDIGTGKQPIGFSGNIVKSDGLWSFYGTKIWGYDLVNIDQPFSAYDFLVFAQDKISELFKRSTKTIVAGGTGFYTDVLAGKITLDSPPPDPSVREYLNTLSLDQLQNELKSKNPKLATTIDLKNKARVYRALEKELLGGYARHVRAASMSSDSFIWVGLTAPHDYLYQRADLWVDAVWSAGIIEETRTFINNGYEKSPRLQGLVYKTIAQYLSGAVKQADAIQRIKFDLHAYIRRQLTWFKKNPQIRWLDISQISRPELEQKVFQIYTEAL